MDLTKLTKATGFSNLYITEEGEAFIIQKVTLSSRVEIDGKYRRVDEYYSGKRFANIMANTYLDNPDNLPQVDHVDHNPENNKLTNLQWITNEANSIKQAFNRKAKLKGIEHDTDRNKFRGYYHVKIDGKRKRYRTARFDTAEEAGTARLELIKSVKGEVIERFRMN